MKTILIKSIALICAVAALLCFTLTFTVTAAGEMAYNIYSSPDTSGTSGRFTTFSIDFLSDDTADGTYWALANFGLYKSRATQKAYKNISGGGAYSGFQDGSYAKNTDGSYVRNPDGTLFQGKVGILSFWEMTYYDKTAKENVIMRAKRIYPEGESTFGGEGEGTNCIMPYAWQDSRWYRLVLHSWDDAENGTTFVGVWFEDLETNEWTLFAYFDTHLYQSCMEGAMSLFMEDYNSATHEEIRTFKTKNIYAQDAADGLWKSLPTCTISYGDGGKANKIGEHEFGATDEYFWGYAGGVVDDQAAYERAAVKQQTYTINQPDQPSFSDPVAPGLTAKKLSGKLRVTWNADPTGAPQQSYTLEAYANGEKIAEKSQTRPEIHTCSLEDFSASEYKLVLTVTDIFGGTTVTTYQTDGYTDDPLPPTETPVTPTPTETPTIPAEITEEIALRAPFAPAKLVVWAAVTPKKED